MKRTQKPPASGLRQPPASGLRQPLSTKAAVSIVCGLLVVLGGTLLGIRAVSAGSRVAPVAREMPRVAREQVTGEFDAKAMARPEAGETTQEGALRRERLEAIRNQPATDARQLP